MDDGSDLGFLIILAVFGGGLYLAFRFLSDKKVRKDSAEELAEDFQKSPINTVVRLAQAGSTFIFFGVLILSVLQLVESGRLILWSAGGAAAFWVLGWFTHGK